MGRECKCMEHNGEKLNGKFYGSRREREALNHSKFAQVRGLNQIILAQCCKIPTVGADMNPPKWRWGAVVSMDILALLSWLWNASHHCYLWRQGEARQ